MKYLLGAAGNVPAVPLKYLLCVKWNQLKELQRFDPVLDVPVLALGAIPSIPNIPEVFSMFLGDWYQ